MRRLLATGIVLAAPVLVGGCNRPIAKIEALRDAVVGEDAAAVLRATEGYPSCPEAPAVALLPNQPSPRDKTCLSEIANALGSRKGFVPSPPDQAAAATAALVVTREGRGDWIAHADTWLGAVKSAKGAGYDALRAAMARKMALAAPLVGRRIDEDHDALAAMKAIAGAIPGACPTYALLGSGADASQLAPELTADHSACVQKDLRRREGPGATYGAGTFRALEGALALWRDAERALRLGLPESSPEVKAALERRLAVIEAATRRIETKRVASAASQQFVSALSELHAEAGVVLPGPDAGASASAAPALKPPPMAR